MSRARVFEMRSCLAFTGLLIVAFAIGVPARIAYADDLSSPAKASHSHNARTDTIAQLQADAVPAPADQVELGFVPITDLSLDIVPKSRDEQGRALMMMPDPAAQFFAANVHGVTSIDQVRMWGLLEYQWEAPAVCYDPLYFEEVNPERYGNTFGCWQPWVSAGHFYATVGLLPLKLILEPPHDCVYTLGHYRPGRCVPFELHCNPVGKFYGCCP